MRHTGRHGGKGPAAVETPLKSPGGTSRYPGAAPVHRTPAHAVSRVAFRPGRFKAARAPSRAGDSGEGERLQDRKAGKGDFDPGRTPGEGARESRSSGSPRDY